MNSSCRRALAALLLIVALVAAGLVAAAWTLLPLDGTAITIDGDRFSLADLTGTHAAVFLVVAVAAAVCAVLVALAAGAFGLGLAALGLAFGGFVALGTLALVAAPFVLFAWLVWRLVRSRPRPLPIRS